MTLRSLQCPGFAFFLLTALLGGCSQASTEPAAGEDELRNGGVCATLDYGHTVGNGEFYRQFASDAAAGDYVTKLLARGVLAGHSGADAKLKEISSDARLRALVAEVYETYRKVYPHETEGLPTPPRIAVVESSVVNAFALGPGFPEDDQARRDQAPWLFIVHTALLNSGLGDTELRGLFAHELGHLILRTLLPEIQDKLRASYRVRESEDGILGAAADNDPAVGAHVEAILAIQKRIGGLPELGLATSASPSSGQYAKLIDILLKQVPPAAASPSCKAAADDSAKLSAAQVALVPTAAFDLLISTTPTPEEQASLDALSATVAADLRACMAGLDLGDASLFDVTAEVNSISESVARVPSSPEHAAVIALMLDAEKRADAEVPGAPLFDRILRAEALLRPAEVTLRFDPAFPIDQLRTFDYEEDADDAAVRILKALGDDPVGIGRMLLSHLPKEAAEACKREVDAGRPVRYGRFVDTHPATCWRYYHATQLAKALDKCPPQPAAARTPLRGSGRPSVATTASHLSNARGYGLGQR